MEFVDYIDETLQVFSGTQANEELGQMTQIATEESLFLEVPPLASDSDSDDGLDVVPGTRVISPKAGVDGNGEYPSGPRKEDYDDDELIILQSLHDPCEECLKWPCRLCNTCGCYICGGKHDASETLVCEKCDNFYHLLCLEPPLLELPKEDWFCPTCLKPKVTSVTELKPPKPLITGKKSGRGIAHPKVKLCTIVDPHYFGPIPGVEVGQSWKFRVQCAESGVHRPPMAGISGSPKTGSQSIVLSGSYKDDVDNGDTFFYTGSGGRETSEKGSRIASGQSFDQTLTKSNAALAVNMNAPLNEAGAVAGNWRNTKPVRVVRSDKMKKNSRFAPDSGFRYDGIYKLARYWPEKGADGFVVYRYEFRRDDPTPAPWTDEGKARIKELGLEMVYPDNWVPNNKRRKRDASDESEQTTKKTKTPYTPYPELIELIYADTINARVWTLVLSFEVANIQEFILRMSNEFKCPVCKKFVKFPCTTICGHNFCRTCLNEHVDTIGPRCPECLKPIVDNEDIKEALEQWKAGGGAQLNEELIKIMRYFGSEYATEGEVIEKDEDTVMVEAGEVEGEKRAASEEDLKANGVTLS